MGTPTRRHLVFNIELIEDRVVPAAYFVSTGGVDGASGAAAQPWKTLQYAADHVHAGDTVTVRAGDYAGFDLFASGTAASRITFTGEAGARVTSQNHRTPDGINLEGASYVTVEGFTVTGVPRAGIRAVEDTDVVIRNNTADANGVWGIFTGFSQNVTIQGNVTSRSGQQHGIYVSNSADNPVIRGNVVWGNNGSGIHMNGDASMGGDGVISNALVENNVLYSNGAAGGSAINADGVQNSTFRNNLIYDAKAAGISLFQIDGGGGSSDNQVVNNTILVNATGRWALSISDGSTGNVVRNNILYSAQSFRGGLSVTADSLAGLVSDYNLTEDRLSLDGGDTALSLAQWRAATGQDAHSLTTTDPSSLFVNAAGGDYHLKAGSAAIDRGTTVGAPATDAEGTARPQGAGVDIGHDELAVSLPPPASPSSPAGSGTLYTDAFTTSVLNPAWTAVGGAWGVSSGAVSQTSTAAGDPKKLLLTGVTTPAAVQVTARVRVDGWQSGDYARAGVGVYTDPVTGQGYNLLFRDGGTVEFLDDYRAWGNSASFAWQTGVWYWFTLEADGAGHLFGKVWADGTPEPAGWTVQQTGWTDRGSGGAVALHGGSSGTGSATASFDDVTVSDRTPGVGLVAPQNLAGTAPAAGRVHLSWDAVPGAATYQVQRSLDGVNWVSAGSTPGSATAFDDPGRTADTLYYYRVAASDATGDSPWSAVAQVTTPGDSALFSDSFDGATLNPAWSAVGGTWGPSGGDVSQTSTAVGDPKKLLLTGVLTPAAVQVTARVRVDSWASGDYARAGLSLFNDADGHGYNLLFRDGGTVEFLDDYRAWGSSYTFAWQTGVWYRMAFRIEGGVLKGKMGADGTAEPADWMFVQTGWTDRTGGAVGLHGGSSGVGSATASFDDVIVTRV